MNTKQLTFEEVNAHFENVDLTPYEVGGNKQFAAADVAAAPGDVLQKVCGIYKIVRPFLLLVSNLPLIPGTWKAAIKVFIELMDKICP